MSWRAFAAYLMVAGLAAGCGESTPPTAPTPPSGPPVLTCPSTLVVPAQAVSGARVTFQTPFATGGRAPVSVACAPASDSVFPVGATAVTCNAADAAGATGTCTFRVEVSPLPRLSRTSFLAFGDSVTAGEVTVPLTTGNGPGGFVFRQLVVPFSSYPTVLLDRLRTRYSAQTPTVVNAGLSGQKAFEGFARFQSAMLTTRPEVVLLLMGYNDLENRSTAEAGIRSMDRMAKEARGRGARLFLATLTPSIQGRLRSQSDALIRQYNDSIRTLAAGEDAVLVDLYQAALPDLNAWIGVDGLHPTEAGYVKIADQFFAAIRADLEVR